MVHVWSATIPPTDQKRLRLYPEIAPTKTSLLQAYEGQVKKFANYPKRNPREPADADEWFRVGAPLDINVCHSDSEASRVDVEACRLLKKSQWTLTRMSSLKSEDLFKPLREGTRTLIELQALRGLGDFDFRAIS